MNNATKERFIKSKPVIAIVGGAGPDAAIDLQMKLSRAMKKKLNISFDQEHYRVIIDNNTDLPNRDEALLSNGSSPLFIYMDSAKKLEKMGGDILIISCNTAHAYFNDIQKVTGMKMINMIAETAIFFHSYNDRIKKVGLLSTAATLEKGLYHQAFNEYKIEVVTPDATHQNKVIQAIYGIKAGFVDDIYPMNAKNKNKLYNIYTRVTEINSVTEVRHPKHLLASTIKYFEERGIEAVILGCTEIPLVLNRKTFSGSCTLIDPTEILANATIDYAISIENKMNQASLNFVKYSK